MTERVTDTPKWPDGPDDLPPVEPWDVTCVRCGHTVSTDRATPEEGDEWECLPCNTAWNLVDDLRNAIAKEQQKNSDLDTALAEARADIKELRENGDRLMRAADSWKTQTLELQDGVRALANLCVKDEIEIMAARAKLREVMKYAEHTYGCLADRFAKNPGKCTCGLDALIEGER